MIKQWHILQPDLQQVEELSRQLGCHPVTATVLINRGICSREEAIRMRQASLQSLRTPLRLQGMDAAVRRIAAALEDRQRILVFGDYDVDGVTATAVLVDFLRAAGADPAFYIPDRHSEGYGLKADHIRGHAVTGGIDLIVTADCGSSDHEAVAAARRAGIDVIVTDHHLIKTPYPDAVAVINPQREDCLSGLEHLSGAGVVFYLVVALRKHLREKGYWRTRREPNLKRYCDLLALATVADMVPLVSENRIFTRAGLEIMNAAARPGIEALKEVAGIAGKPVDAEDIAYRLAPRINAAGRIGHASEALALLLTRDRRQASEIASKLDELNTTRQQLEKDCTGAVLARLQADPGLLKNRVLVMADPDWHEGVLGIAASRIVNQFYRPVVLLSVKEGIAKGSARSIPGIDLFEALTTCRQWLEGFGGHAQAAGLSLAADNIDPFREQLDIAVRGAAAPNTFIPKMTIDAELNFGDIGTALLEELEALKPYGSSLPEPLFLARGVEVTSARIVGGHHRRMTLGQKSAGGQHRLAAIHFNPGGHAAGANRFDRIAYRLRRNVWNGRSTLQLTIEEAQPSQSGSAD